MIIINFVAFVEDNATMSLIRYFEKSCIVFCAKPKEVDPIKLNFCITKISKCFSSTEILSIITNGVI